MQKPEWVTIGRPGPSGKRRDEIFARWDREFGKGNWRIAWEIESICVDFHGECALYEDAYYNFLLENPEIRNMLVNEARDVYDDDPSNVKSAFDYSVQETVRAHLQDIAIRRALLRMGLWFKGTELVQIRHRDGKHRLSGMLTPGKVPFHMPAIIKQPELAGWWDFGSVESQYQSCKVLQVVDGE